MRGFARALDERLDELRQCIEPARGEHFSRQPDEEIGIDERHARQHEGAAQARLHPSLPCSREPSTAFFVTSEPVPAVVGSAMKGSDGA